MCVLKGCWKFWGDFSRGFKMVNIFTGVIHQDHFQTFLLAKTFAQYSIYFRITNTTKIQVLWKIMGYGFSVIHICAALSNIISQFLCFQVLPNQCSWRAHCDCINKQNYNSLKEMPFKCCPLFKRNNFYSEMFVYMNVHILHAIWSGPSLSNTQIHLVKWVRLS